MAQKALRLEIHPVSDLTAEQKRAFRRLKKYLQGFLRTQGKKIAADIAEAYANHKPEKLTDDELRYLFQHSSSGYAEKIIRKAENDKTVERILRSASFDEWDVVADEASAILGPTFEQSAEIVLGKLEIDDQSIFDLVSERAVDYAEENAADLVTSITETTRDRLRTVITDAVENAKGVQELRQAIEDNGAFSSDRAEMIARTEIGNAHMGGALEGAKSSGLELKKAIIRGSQEFDCEICGENEDAGDIELTEFFPSGDLSPLFHPNCECTMIFHQG